MLKNNSTSQLYKVQLHCDCKSHFDYKNIKCTVTKFKLYFLPYNGNSQRMRAIQPQVHLEVVVE